MSRFIFTSESEKSPVLHASRPTAGAPILLIRSAHIGCAVHSSATDVEQYI